MSASCDPLGIVGNMGVLEGKDVLVEAFQRFCPYLHPDARMARESEQPCGEAIYKVFFEDGHSEGGYHGRFLTS